MENWRNSYYLRDLDNPTIGNGNNGSNIPNTKTGRASNSHTISNPIEPNPSNPPVRPRIPADSDTNPIEPNPRTPPVRVEKPVNTDTNPIEPNPVTHPVRPEKPADSDTNPIEPNPSTPPVRVEKPVNTDTNPIEPNPVTHPVRPERPADMDTNPIEPNPDTPPVRPERPDDSDTNSIEPNPGTPPVRPERSADTDTNSIEPNPDTPQVSDEKLTATDTNLVEHDLSSPPLRDEKQSDTGNNQIEANPSPHPVRTEKPAEAATNLTEPNLSTPPARDEKLTATDTNRVEPNPSNSTNAGTKIGNDTLESKVHIDKGSGIKLADDSSTKGIDKNDEIKSTISVPSIPASNITTDESNKSLSPTKMAKKALSNLLKWGPENFKTTNKNDMLAAYYDDKLTNKKLSFDASYKEVQDDLPMQKDKNGKVIYPNTCKYNSTIGAVRLSGYTYKDDLTKEDVEKITNKAVSSKKCKLHTDVIKEVFGLDAVYYEIPAGLSEKELKALVGDNPAMIRFPQRAFWGNDKLPEDGEHGIGYVNGGFIEPYMGRHGESWKDVRGARSTADFTSNLGGLYFEIKK